MSWIDCACVICLLRPWPALTCTVTSSWVDWLRSYGVAFEVSPCSISGTRMGSYSKSRYISYRALAQSLVAVESQQKTCGNSNSYISMGARAYDLRSAMGKMKVSKSGLQLQLYTMLYDSNTTVPSNPRYCYSLLSNCLLNLQKGQNSRLIN